MKVTICELPNDPDRLTERWQHLATHTHSVGSDLVLLPEMPFSPWLAASKRVDHQRWQQAVESHCPRVTPASSTDKWIAAGRTAAVMAGAFCLSSNLSGSNGSGSDFGGTGWLIEPEDGSVLGTTAADEPFLTVDIDPGWAQAAKGTYPRYVMD